MRIHEILFVNLLITSLFIHADQTFRCGSLQLRHVYGVEITSEPSITAYEISFDSCSKLLSISSTYSDAFYKSKVCFLFRRDLTDDISIFIGSSSHEKSWGIVVHKRTKLHDKHCILPSVDSSLSYAMRQYRNCLATSSHFDKQIVSHLPFLNIIISVTNSWISRNQQEMKKVIDHWSCYCNSHNYKFTLNILPHSDISMFFVARHEEILMKYLSQSQYVLHIDADSAILNMSRTIEEIVLRPHHLNTSVFVQMRENFEITSGIYVIRNDDKAKCFLQYWRDMHPPYIYYNTTDQVVTRQRIEYKSNHHHLRRFKIDQSPVIGYTFKTIIPVPNYCNGALVSALVSIAAPHLIAKCLLSSPSNISWIQIDGAPQQSPPPSSTTGTTNGTSTKVLQKMVLTSQDGFAYGEHRCMYKLRAEVFNMDQGPWSEGGVYVMWGGEGLWRSHERPHDQYSNSQIWYRDKHAMCYPHSDFIGHGDKNILTNLHESRYGERCDLNVVTTNNPNLFQHSNNNYEYLFPSIEVVEDNKLSQLLKRKSSQIRHNIATNLQSNVGDMSRRVLGDENGEVEVNNLSSGILEGHVNRKCAWHNSDNGELQKVLRRYCIFSHVDCIIPLSLIDLRNESNLIHVLQKNQKMTNERKHFVMNHVRGLNMSEIYDKWMSAVNHRDVVLVNQCILPSPRDLMRGHNINEYCGEYKDILNYYSKRLKTLLYM